MMGAVKANIKLVHTLKVVLAMGSAVGLLISVLAITGVFESLELRVLNSAFLKRPPIERKGEIVTVDIDDSAISTIGRWPWSWDRHAALLDFLTMYRARTVAFIDMDFSKEPPFSFPLKSVEDYKNLLSSAAAGQGGADRVFSVLPDFNNDFYRSLGKNGETCFAVGLKMPDYRGEMKGLLQVAETNAGMYDERRNEGARLLKERIVIPGNPDGLHIATDILPLTPEILQYSECAGFNNIGRDEDGVVHKYPLIANYRGSIYPSVGLQLARKVLDASDMKIKAGEYIELRSKNRQLRIPVNRQGEMYINWTGPYRESFPHIPFNLAAFFIGHQMAKDELARHSAELERDPMLVRAALMQRLLGSRLFSETMAGDISAYITVGALIERAVVKADYKLPVEDILAALNIVDPKDEAWLGAARQIYFNNYLLKKYEATGKLPAFGEVLGDTGFASKKELAQSLKDSYDMMAFCIENRLVDKVRPLYFAPAQESTQGKKKLSISPLFFRDKVVFYGLTAAGLAEQTASPFEVRHIMLDMVPNVVNTILTGNFIHEMPPVMKYLLSYAYLFGILFLILLLSPVQGFLLACLAAGAHLGIAWLFFSKDGYIMPVSQPIAAISASYLSAVAYRYFQEQRERKRVRSMFSTMVSPEVLKIMEENPDKFSLSGEKREATLFSSDVSGFTTISEGVTARELATILNIYLTPMSNIIMSYDGYVDKYEGDAIKADFGVPMHDPDHPWKACFSALYQQEELKVIQRMILLKYGVGITARMGINTGVISAGNMGSERRMQYTVMGEAAALAEELEPANKLFGTWIAIGPATYAQAKDFIEVRFLSNLAAGHSEGKTPVYELVGWKKDKFLGYWKGKPIPGLELEAFRKMPPEKVLACHDFYRNKHLPESRMLADLQGLFAELKDPAIEYMRAGNIRSVLFIIKELEALKQCFHGHECPPDANTPDGLARDIAELGHAASAETEEWKRALLQWKKELKECSSSLCLLQGKMSGGERDHCLNMIDILEKSVECIYKRIAFAVPDDHIATEMAGHLRELIAGSTTLAASHDMNSLNEKSASLEGRIGARLSGFVDGLKDRADEYHEMVAEFCAVSEEQRKVIELFKEGQAFYFKREWEDAAARFREALADGPSAKFIEKIEELKKNPPAEDWDGAWEG
ncbi:MAG TPA: adenylate/guanylate cyclase domain-containing protein [Dissulfurispiraceae bacterium]